MAPKVVRAVCLVLAVGCEPKLSVTPAELDGFHRTCQKRMAEGFKLQASKNVGFARRKPKGTPVVIYGAHWCEPCHIAAAYLDRRGIPFVEYDVDRDRVAQADMVRTLESVGVFGRYSLPVIDVRGTVISGFNPCVVDAAWAG